MARNEAIANLRALGYTYDAIAYELYTLGLTPRVLSRVRIQQVIREVCPHLAGHVRRTLGLPALLHRRDIDPDMQQEVVEIDDADISGGIDTPPPAGKDEIQRWAASIEPLSFGDFRALQSAISESDFGGLPRET